MGRSVHDVAKTGAGGMGGADIKFMVFSGWGDTNHVSVAFCFWVSAIFA